MARSCCDRALSLLRAGRLPHAVILEGAGADAAADELARAAVCTAGEKPCGVCPECIRAHSGNHPDIIHCRGKGQTGALNIEQIRDIRLDAYIRPNEAARKVYILHDAEKMLTAAQNALLKLLEEPPAYILLLLCCREKKGLLETVLSRAVLLSAEAEAGAPDETALQAAHQMAAAVTKVQELSLLKAVYSAGQDKLLFRAALQALQALFRETYRAKAGHAASHPIAAELAAQVTLGQALALLRAAEETAAAMERNANHALNLTRFCAQLRRAVGR